MLLDPSGSQQEINETQNGWFEKFNREFFPKLSAEESPTDWVT